MRKSGRIARHTDRELDDLLQRSEDRTEFARVDALTEAELEAAIDRAEEGEIDWDTIQVGLPRPKQQLTVRVDRDVIDWFKAQGPGYQTRMNAVLRSFVEAQTKRTGSGTAGR